MTRRFAVKKALGLEWNIVAVSVAMFLLALGENLWKRFLPKYLPPAGAVGTPSHSMARCGVETG